jgi:hypothetical protein
MPVPFAPLHRHFKTLTYWPVGTRNKAGEIETSTPVCIKGAWQKSVEFVDEIDGIRKKATDIIYTCEEVEEEGYLYEGVSEETNPQNVVGRVVRIFRVKRLNDINQNYSMTKAWAAL